MSNPAENIISKLEWKFTEQLSIKNSVMTADGEIVRINKELWMRSPVLREHFVSGYSHKIVEAPKSVLVALIKAHEYDAFPEGIQEAFDLLAAASELEFEDLASKCLDNLSKYKGIDASVDFPPELSVGTVMRFFKVLSNSPLRTYYIYEKQLSRIARYCADNRDVMTNAMNLLKQSFLKFKLINLGAIPINFETQIVPVAIYKRKGKLQTVVILGRKVIPVNLFGSHINLDNTVIWNNFYLKYGVYLLYRCCGFVYYKNIQDDSEPVEQLSRCSIFITRRNSVFAVHDDNDCHSISRWTSRRNFEKIYQSDKKIIKVDFEHSTRVLAVKLAEHKLLLFRLVSNTLLLLEEKAYPGAIDVILSGRDMFTVQRNDYGCWIETHRVETEDNEKSSRPIDKQPNDGEVPAMCKEDIPRSSFYHFGGSHFLTRLGRLELLMHFPLLDRTKTLMTDGELHAISELCVSP